MSNKAIEKTRKHTESTVRYEEWVNKETGEVREFAVIDKEVQNDYGFHKVWLEDLAMVLGVIGGQKLKVFSWLLQHINPVTNEIGFTQEELARETGTNQRTVLETVKSLVAARFMKKIRIACYKVNPKMLIKGNSNKRGAMMIIYDQIPEQKQINFDENA